MKDYFTNIYVTIHSAISVIKSSTKSIRKCMRYKQILKKRKKNLFHIKYFKNNIIGSHQLKTNLRRIVKKIGFVKILLIKDATLSVSIQWL